jgi:hypothetical protein
MSNLSLAGFCVFRWSVWGIPVAPAHLTGFIGFSLERFMPPPARFQEFLLRRLLSGHGSHENMVF